MTDIDGDDDGSKLGALSPTRQPRLADARAVVTGASSGIGRAIALAFTDAGATVLATHRASPDGAQALAALIAARGGRAHTTQADLSDAAACDRLVAEAHATLGGIDVWVNNAGADILTTDAAQWSWGRKLDLLLAVDLRGTIACSYAVAAIMARQPGGGTIVNMGWDHVSQGMAGRDAELFSAVKGGVLAFSRSLARSVAPVVRVNVLCPGWIETEFGRQADPQFRESVASATPMQRWGRPEDVADTAVWLASDEASFVTGQAINVNGGVLAS